MGASPSWARFGHPHCWASAGEKLCGMQEASNDCWPSTLFLANVHHLYMEPVPLHATANDGSVTDVWLDASSAHHS